MKQAILLGIVALLGASAAAQAADATTYGKQLVSTAQVAKSRPGSFDVYIDGPTHFVYVNTPSGWKFVRHLPASATPTRNNTTLATF